MATVAEKKTGAQEVRKMKFRIYTPLRFREASVDQKTGSPIARVVIITEGLGNLRDRNYYTASAVKSSAEVFRGKQFYINHPSQSEEEDRPERDVRDLAGYFVETAVTTVKDPDTGETLTACLATLKFSTSQGGRDALEQVKTALQYANDFPDSKDVYCGISINGGGVSHSDAVDGMDVNMVTEIQEAFSADIVTKPARGGKFLALVQEAAKAAAWRRERAKESRTERRNAVNASQARTGHGKGTHMATATIKKKESQRGVSEGKKPGVKTTGKTKEVAKIGPKKMARLRAGLKEALKDAKKGVLSLKGLRVVVEAATATGKKMSQLGEKLGKMQAAAEEPKGQLSDMIMDLQQDLGELAKALGMGGAADGGDDAAAGDAVAQDEDGEEEDEDEDEQGTLGDMGDSGAGADAAGAAAGSAGAAGDQMAEDEDEEEAEGKTDESEDEEESETRAGESEDEEESEGRTDESENEEESKTNESEDEEESEGKTDESEDEEESEGRTDESEDEEEGEGADGAAGMKSGGAPAPMRMAYKCAQCGETNQVAPPKGFALSKMDEAGMIKMSRSSEAQALKSTVDRLKRVLKTKEGRFVATNKRYAKMMEQNIALRAEVTAHRRYGKARKLLAEAHIPKNILSVTDLLSVEPESWPTQIKIARNTMRAIATREGDVYNNAGTHAGGNVDGGKGKQQDSADVAITAFKESYSAGASR